MIISRSVSALLAANCRMRIGCLALVLVMGCGTSSPSTTSETSTTVGGTAGQVSAGTGGAVGGSAGSSVGAGGTTGGIGGSGGVLGGRDANAGSGGSDASGVDGTMEPRDANPSMDQDAADAQGSDFVGPWCGTTSQGSRMSFVVESAGIKQLSFAWSVSGCSGETTTTFSSPSPVTGGSFSAHAPGGPGGVEVTFAGTFGSATTASGTLMFRAIPIPGVPSCSGSASAMWTATNGPCPSTADSSASDGAEQDVGSSMEDGTSERKSDIDARADVSNDAPTCSPSDDAQSCQACVASQCCAQWAACHANPDCVKGIDAYNACLIAGPGNGPPCQAAGAMASGSNGGAAFLGLYSCAANACSAGTCPLW